MPMSSAFFTASAIPLAVEAQNQMELLHIYADGDALAALHTNVDRNSDVVIIHVPKGGSLINLIRLECCDVVEVTYCRGRPWIFLCLRNTTATAQEFSCYWTYIPSIPTLAVQRRQDLHLLRHSEVVPRIAFLGETETATYPFCNTLHFLCFGKTVGKLGYECDRCSVTSTTGSPNTKPVIKSVVKDFSWHQVDYIGQGEQGACLLTLITRERVPKTGEKCPSCLVQVYRFENRDGKGEVIRKMTFNNAGTLAFHLGRKRWNAKCVTGRVRDSTFAALIPDPLRVQKDGALDNILLCYQSEANVSESTVILSIISMFSGKRLSIECTVPRPQDLSEGAPSVTFFCIRSVIFAALQDRFLCFTAHVIPTFLCSIPWQPDLFSGCRQLSANPTGISSNAVILTATDGTWSLWKTEANTDVVSLLQDFSSSVQTEAETCAWLTCIALLGTSDQDLDNVVAGLGKHRVFTRVVALTYITESLRRVLCRQDDVVLRRLGSWHLQAIPSMSGERSGLVWTTFDLAEAKAPAEALLSEVFTLGEVGATPAPPPPRTPPEHWLDEDRRRSPSILPLSPPQRSHSFNAAYEGLLRNSKEGVFSPKALTTSPIIPLAESENIFGYILLKAKLTNSQPAAHAHYGRRVMDMARVILRRLTACFDPVAGLPPRESLVALEHLIGAVESIPLPTPPEWRQVAGRLACQIYPRMAQSQLLCAGSLITSWTEDYALIAAKLEVPVEAVRVILASGRILIVDRIAQEFGITHDQVRAVANQCFSVPWKDNEDRVTVTYAGAAAHPCYEADGAAHRRLLGLRIEDRCAGSSEERFVHGSPCFPQISIESQTLLSQYSFGPLWYWANGPSYQHALPNYDEVSSHLAKLLSPLIPPIMSNQES